MALRPDRLLLETDGSCTLSDVAAPGVGVCWHTGGSGEALGFHQGRVQLASNPSGLKFAGILLQNVVNVDETRYHINWNKEEQNIGDNVEVLKKGWVVTNKISGTPTIGSKAYLTTSGQFTPTVSSTGGLVATPYAGQFDSTLDEDGYAKVSVNLPNGQL